MAKEDRTFLEELAHDVSRIALDDLAQLSDRELVELIVGGCVYDAAAIPA